MRLVDRFAVDLEAGRHFHRARDRRRRRRSVVGGGAAAATMAPPIRTPLLSAMR